VTKTENIAICKPCKKKEGNKGGALNDKGGEKLVRHDKADAGTIFEGALGNSHSRWGHCKGVKELDGFEGGVKTEEKRKKSVNFRNLASCSKGQGGAPNRKGEDWVTPKKEKKTCRKGDKQLKNGTEAVGKKKVAIFVEGVSMNKRSRIKQRTQEGGKEGGGEKEHRLNNITSM